MIPFDFDDVGLVLKYVFNLVYEFRDIIILLFALDLFGIAIRTLLESFGLIGSGAGVEESLHQYHRYRK